MIAHHIDSVRRVITTRVAGGHAGGEGARCCLDVGRAERWARDGGTQNDKYGGDESAPFAREKSEFLSAGGPGEERRPYDEVLRVSCRSLDRQHARPQGCDQVVVPAEKLMQGV